MLGRATLTLPASPSAMVLADTVAVGFAQEARLYAEAADIDREELMFEQ